MGKSSNHPSLRGKKPVNTAGSAVARRRPVTTNPGRIRNKLKRSEMYGRYLEEKRRRKRELRLKRAKEAEALGEEGREEKPKAQPRTLESAREAEPTSVRPDDGEVAGDEAEDEFAPYFSDEIRPKILITTRPCPSAELFHFVGDLMRFLPRLYYYPRRKYSVKDICTYATNRNFTHLIVLSEKAKKCDGMIISHLRPSAAATAGGGGGTADPSRWRGGPTAFFKVSGVVSSNDVPFRGSASSHVPELVLNGFTTRLGHRAGRFLGSLFPHNAQFRGRQVATFHCQRDYIFVRHHRYVFEEGREANEATGQKRTAARLQELGPRFTLKMRWLQEGTFDTQFGEYEWFHKRKEMDTTRRKFHL